MRFLLKLNFAADYSTENGFGGLYRNPSCDVGECSIERQAEPAFPGCWGGILSGMIYYVK